jgi:hypothetical protein
MHGGSRHCRFLRRHAAEDDRSGADEHYFDLQYLRNPPEELSVEEEGSPSCIKTQALPAALML